MTSHATAGADEFPRAFGEYELLGEVARGAMGVVYRARQLDLERVVALKMILPGRLASDSQIRRFRAEAQASGKLRHPGVVPVHQVGIVEDQHYFSMEYIEGASLEQLVSDAPSDPHYAARLAQQVALALEYAHDNGVIHRDIKPSNILLKNPDHPVLTDFGLAKLLSETGETASGDVLGTASYMSPEQAEGRHQDVGPRSDVFSLGAVLYALLTGRPPFLGPGFYGTLRQVVERDPISISVLTPDAPRDLATICHKCLHKDPDRRYATAGDLALDLELWLDGRPILARAVGPFERALSWCRRRPQTTALIAAIVLTAGVGAFGVLSQWRVAVNALAEARQADHARMSTQVSHLSTADAAALPELLDSLRRESDPEKEIPALIRASLESDELSDAQRLALELAFFEVEARGPAALDRIVDGMLRADPERFIAARSALVRNVNKLDESERQHLRGALQSKAVAVEESSAGMRLRAIAALAAIFPEADTVSELDPALLTHALSANALHLRAWCDALLPLGSMLSEPLLGVLSDTRRNPGERQVAIALLTEFSARDGQSISGLVSRTKPEELARLLLADELGARRENWTTPLLEALSKATTTSVAERLTTPPEVPASARALVREANGWIGANAAFCLTLPLRQLEDLAEELRPLGYRPNCLRPWAEEGGAYASVTWLRDRVPWDWVIAARAAEAKDASLRMEQAGHYPVSIGSWLEPGAPATNALYAVTFALADALPSTQNNRLEFADSPEAALDLNQLADAAGAIPISYTAATDRDGLRTYGWVQQLRAQPTLISPGIAISGPQMELHPFPAMAQTDCPSVWELDQDEPRFHFIGHVERSVETMALAGDAPQNHRERALALVMKGYLPKAVSVLPSPDGSRRVAASVWQRERASAQESTAEQRGIAQLGLGLALLGENEPLLELLSAPRNEGLRAQVAHRVPQLSDNLHWIGKWLTRDHNSAALRTLVVAMGGMLEAHPESLSPSIRERLRELYVSHSDPGVHAACGWLMKRAGLEIPRVAPNPDQPWSDELEGHTLVHLRGVKRFIMGSVEEEVGRLEEEYQHHRVIEHDFAISSREVDNEQFQRFIEGADLEASANWNRSDSLAQPAGGISRVVAMQYCRWLSELAGMPESEMCYPPVSEITPLTSARPDFLERAGYRLPTQSEWEYAARGGSAESRFCGPDESLLTDYAWYRNNSESGSRPTGLLAPNPYGLFDMLGNLWEWCHTTEGLAEIPLVGGPLFDRGPDTLDSRFGALRGGSFDNPASLVRSAAIRHHQSERTSPSVGFRIARTLLD